MPVTRVKSRNSATSASEDPQFLRMLRDCSQDWFIVPCRERWHNILRQNNNLDDKFRVQMAENPYCGEWKHCNSCERSLCFSLVGAGAQRPSNRIISVPSTYHLSLNPNITEAADVYFGVCKIHFAPKALAAFLHNPFFSCCFAFKIIEGTLAHLLLDNILRFSVRGKKNECADAGGGICHLDNRSCRRKWSLMD